MSKSKSKFSLSSYAATRRFLAGLVAASVLVYLAVTAAWNPSLAQHPRLFKAIQAIFPTIKDPRVWRTPSTSNRVRLVVASCAYQNKAWQPMYKFMTEATPDHILLMGDNVYMDISPSAVCSATEYLSGTYKPDSIACFNLLYSQQKWFQSPATIAQQYDVLLNRNDFLMKLDTKNAKYGVWAMWDDHDYGADNLDARNPYKNMTRVGFVKFWNAVNSKFGHTGVQRVIDGLQHTANANRGVQFTSVIEKTLPDGSTIKIRLYGIDVRWYRDGQTTLGPVQKEWLKSVITTQSAGIDFHVFISGLTLFTDLKISGLAQLAGKESWFPGDVSFLTNLLKANNLIKKSLILNGDVHYSTVNARDGVFEIVASSLTHSLGDLSGLAAYKLSSGASSKTKYIVSSNSFGVIDIGKDGWELKFVDELGEVISSSDYTMNSQAFSSTILKKGSVVQDCWFPFCWFPEEKEEKAESSRHR